jgi:MATE family multidrug resistance protein
MNRKILELAIPNIISNISIPLLGLVDMALMGRMESDAYIGAIAIGSLIFNFIYWGLGFLRMGTSGFTAQSWGRRDLQEIILVFSRALFIGLIISLLLILLQRPIEWLSFAVIRGESEVEELARIYFRIRIWAAPAVLGQFALLGFFLGMQNARLPMVVLVSTNIINIIFNYYFVMVRDMGSDGVALGTLIAQYSGFLLGSVFFLAYFRRLIRYWSKKAMLKLSRLKQFLVVNQDIFIRTMCLVIVFSFFTARSASTDTLNEGEQTVLAVNSLLMQFFMLFSFFIDGFAHASEALTGRFIGAGNREKLARSIKLIFIWGTGISLFFTILYLGGSRTIFRLLTNNLEVIGNAQPYFFWVILIPFISYSAFLWDGIYIGATAGRAMRNSMLISTVLVFFPVYIILSNFMGNNGLWLAFILFMLSRTVTMSIMAPKAIYSRID